MDLVAINQTLQEFRPRSKVRDLQIYRFWLEFLIISLDKFEQIGYTILSRCVICGAAATRFLESASADIIGCFVTYHISTKTQIYRSML